ncbi:hypothetical protein ACFVIC_42365, partial [Streptomyces sp. NPDC127133]|uniref:hypothetical protein n=1 Tax=Streptomyces sp. NPDC127133 TaxID=3345375 RepID=UPI00362BE61B
MTDRPTEPHCSAPGCGRPEEPDHLGLRQGHRFRQVMEVQPLAADATMPRIDMQAPYCYAAYRFDQTPPEMISWGSWDEAPGPFVEAYHAATHQVSYIRVQHQYYGPMKVSIWQRRADEHYSQAPPADAYALYVGDPNDTMRAELAALRERADGRDLDRGDKVLATAK